MGIRTADWITIVPAIVNKEMRVSCDIGVDYPTQKIRVKGVAASQKRRERNGSPATRKAGKWRRTLRRFRCMRFTQRVNCESRVALQWTWCSPLSMRKGEGDQHGTSINHGLTRGLTTDRMII